jgi:wyosine [tRNA(Phe)-imidazoG37] synthetase (radical SAM superfamily)
MEMILMMNKRQNPTEPDQLSSLNNGGIYEIKIKGFLDEHWKQWFAGMELRNETNGETGQECTLITGLIADQPALHGLLTKIRDLNLTLISVRKINPKDSGKQGKDRDDTNDGVHQKERL